MNADPADVPALAVVEIEPAEAQAVLRGVELGELLAYMTLNASRSVRA